MQNSDSQNTHSIHWLTLAALGVVFGDIGTSPLYAMKESFHAAHNLVVNLPNVLGILSIIFWTLTAIISVKYAMLMMRADNHGEGGIMALLALNLRHVPWQGKARHVLVWAAFGGAALFFGDGIITPAISVLSAIEGLAVASPALSAYVLPLAIGVLIALFAVQRFGTAAVGKFFGWITLSWFISLAVFGLMSITQTPIVLQLFNPYWAMTFIIHHAGMAFVIMGAVVLTVTGGEALYADMGHFGAKPIRRAWFFVVMPCLLLNYAGQGALLLRQPESVRNPFFLLLPEWALYPMIILATLAAVIASQAVISGVFSLAYQAVQLGYLPRLRILHTSAQERGQIYVPMLNWLLLPAVIVVVLIFGDSSRLAEAYGLAVTLTMLCDSVLLAILICYGWKWHKVKLFFVCTPLILLDLILVGATSVKLLAGGWFPLAIGSTAFIIMLSWRVGRDALQNARENDTLPLKLLIDHLDDNITIVEGDAVFLTSSQTFTPRAMLHNMKHNKVLHRRNILLTIKIENVPYVGKQDLLSITQLNEQFYTVMLHYGFKDGVNVPKALKAVYAKMNWEYNDLEISYFISRERVLYAKHSSLDALRGKLFIGMHRNVNPVSDAYRIPSNRVVELGTQFEI